MMLHVQPHIRYFIAVAEELHFRRAGERLHVAQPVLSRAVRRVEDSLGIKLLRRTSRQVDLTAAGQVFLEDCRLAIEALHRAESRAHKAERGELGQLTLGYTDFAISGPLPGILAIFHERCPGLSIDLVRRNSHEQIIDLEAGRIDIGFLTSPVSGDELSHFTVQEDPFIVVLPRDHCLAELDEVPLRALANEPFVLGSLDSWRHFAPQIFSFCRAAGFVPRVVREGFNSDSIFGLVAAKMGVTIYPDCDLNRHRRDLVIRPLKDLDARLSTEVAWSTNTPDPAVQQFIEVVRSSSTRGDHTSSPVRD